MKRHAVVTFRYRHLRNGEYSVYVQGRKVFQARWFSDIEQFAAGYCGETRTPVYRQSI